MNEQELLNEMHSLGTEEKRKIYRRHGVGERMFGVSYADIERLKRRIGRNHSLAEKLWLTGIFEARLLAIKIADPKQMTEALLESWAESLTDYVVTNTFVSLVQKTPFARKKMARWTCAKSDLKGRAGWLLVGNLALRDKELPDEFFADYLQIIERDIHKSKNRTRDAMNSALIDIGLRNHRLKKAAIAAAKRIGKVEVDHGETGCVTPDALSHIKKGIERRR